MKTKLIPITSLDQLKVGDLVKWGDSTRKVLDKDHAIKIANEKRAQYINNQP